MAHLSNSWNCPLRKRIGLNSVVEKRERDLEKKRVERLRNVKSTFKGKNAAG